MKYFVLVLFFLLSVQQAFSLQVIYPNSNPVNINCDTTFFVGNINEKDSILSINNEPIKVHESGGFLKFIHLNRGKNIFVLKTENDELEFVINNVKKDCNCPCNNQFAKFETEKYLQTTKNNVPLRTTPINAGINRIAHYPSGVQLVADGEQNGFYRIVLNNMQRAFIDKDNVAAIDKTDFATLSDYKRIKNDDFEVFEFNLDKKIPYVVEEGESLKLNLFNIKGYENNTFTFSVPLKHKLFGYEAYYADNKLFLKIRKKPLINAHKPLLGITITVDAGHGGNEIGTTGCTGVREKDVNLKIAKYLQKELRKKGANVVMTRVDDVNVSLNKRIEIANNSDSAIFLSIHNSAFPDDVNPENRRGTSVFYYYPQAKELSEYLLKYINEEAKTANDGVNQASFAVVRNTSAVSVLIEFGYMIHPEDNVMIIDEKFQRKCAKAVADAVERYFADEYK